MRLKYTWLLFISHMVLCLHAQDSLSNGGFEKWRGGYFSPGRGGQSNTEKCCGSALAVPTYWGIVEQLMQMPTNQFVFKAIDSAYVHSGYFSAQLLTDTTTRDSAGDVADARAVLIPGLVTCAGIVAYGSIGMKGDLYQTIAYSIGYPFVRKPVALNFYMFMDHPVSDTAGYAYALTRWDSVNMKEDTLAVNDVELPDEEVASNEWLLFSDTLQYLLPGAPDSLHLIFFGGRNADITKLGNSTWLDDISFYYGDSSTGPTGLVHLDVDDAVTVYPNPASSTLHVGADAYMAGDIFEVYDLIGNRVMRPALQGISSSYDIVDLSSGIYYYRLLDKNASSITTGKFAVAR